MHFRYAAGGGSLRRFIILNPMYTLNAINDSSTTYPRGFSPLAGFELYASLSVVLNAALA